MNRLKTLLDGLDFDGVCPLISFEEGCWYIRDREIHWNTDDNLEDLYNQKGNTCEGYMTEDKGISGGYLIANIDTCTGCWVTSFFKLSDRVNLEDLEEMYGSN